MPDEKLDPDAQAFIKDQGWTFSEEEKQHLAEVDAEATAEEVRLAELDAEARGLEAAPASAVPAVETAPEAKPEVKPEPAPVVPTVEQAQLTQLQQERAAFAEQQAVVSINQAAGQYKQQLIAAYKMSDADAHAVATQYAEGLYSRYKLQEVTARAGALAKESKAREVAVKTGVPVEVLMQYNDPQSMEAAGTVFQRQAVEIAALKKQVGAVVQKAPVAKPDSNRGSPGAGTNSAARRANFAAGAAPNTAEEFEKAYGYRP